MDDEHLPTADGNHAGDAEDRPPSELRDVEDRNELRRRYYGLLQELRVLLPGVQLLLAFLLTVPFAAGFDGLDDVERLSYGVAICSATMATITFVAPTAFHRVADRRKRSARLVWAIRCLVTGLVFLAISLVASILCVTKVVFDGAVALVVAAALSVSILVLWVAIPMIHRNPGDDDQQG